MADVRIDNVSKSYGSVKVIHGVSVDITDGEFVILVGPSGCGKSTLLRMVVSSAVPASSFRRRRTPPRRVGR